MTAWEIFWKIAESNPGSVGILLFGLTAFLLYGITIWWRIGLVERTVVTKADLLEFEKSLLNTLRKEFRPTGECEIQHDAIKHSMEIMDKRIDRKADVSLLGEIIKNT